jgi:putative restriction endonuclease
MNMWIGITDNNWFNYLAVIKPDEVNFWQPSPISFKVLKPNEPFLFKLKRSNEITGGGFFVRYHIMPLSLAWKTYGEKNGAPSYSALRNLILEKRSQYKLSEMDPVIGCIILSDPFFFSVHNSINQPYNFSKTIVRGKGYRTDQSPGMEIWQEVKRWFESRQERYSFVENHRGTGIAIFRENVTIAYHSKCSLTGEKTLPALDVTQIKPAYKSGPYHVNNGILLRSDVHKLFDSGYITITTDFRLEVSRRIREEYENGGYYYAFHSKKLENLPDSMNDRPSYEYLKWHNDNMYKG